MKKRLFRSKDRIIGGVCSGIAEYFNIDPTLVRLLWVASLLFFGIGFLTYLIFWIVIPNEPE